MGTTRSLILNTTLLFILLKFLMYPTSSGFSRPDATLRYEERETLPSKRSVQPGETTSRRVLRMEVSL